MNSYIKNIIDQYNATHRVAFYHPRNKTISLNGGRELSIAEAIKSMRECLK